MILLTGATGFTGKFVLEELVKRGAAVKCFIRPTSKGKLVSGKSISVFEGNIKDPGSWDSALEDVSGIINIVSFKGGHIPILLDAACRNKVKRTLFISTTAIFTKLNAESKKMRVEVEKQIMSSSLCWTILRPTMIYGTSGDRNIYRLIRFVKRFPVHPILGKGDKLIQPIYVKDLARAIVTAYYSDISERKVYNLAGKKPVTYKDCIKTVARVLGKKEIIAPLPLWASLFAVKIAEFIPLMPKFTTEQVLRLNEDKAFSYRDAERDFGFSPLSFEDGVREEIEEYFLHPKSGA